MNLDLLTRRVCLYLAFAGLIAATHVTPARSEEPQKPASVIADPGLEAAVRAEVYEKRHNAEPITVEDLKNISRVIGRGKKIKDLSGLEHCAALMSIDLTDNEISNLAPLSKLTRLQSVMLANNQIADLGALKELTAMQLLDLSGNKVTDLAALSGMKNLRTLYVARNQLTSLQPIAELSKIWSLDASANQLTDLAPVSGLAWLTTLDVRQNQIKSLEPLAPLRELKYLLLSGNQIADLTSLVAMCRKDAEGEKRFAPYLQLYIQDNPLSDAAKQQLDELKSVGVRVQEIQ